MSYQSAKRELKRRASQKRKRINSNFFKTSKGEYGEHDSFMGVSVPEIRSVIRMYPALSLIETVRFLRSPLHEERLFALLMLVRQYNDATEAVQKKIFRVYLANIRHINNWDLVDSSAHHIIGAYLWNKPKHILMKLAQSRIIWERRIAIVATYYFIKRGRLKETFIIATTLLRDEHDLIQKAVGWMLREAGKYDERALKIFLKKHYRYMPRTMLRYAIEKFSKNTRKNYLNGRV